MSLEALRARRREILALAARHGARDPRVFGSVARGDENPRSDVDILVDIEDGRSLLDLIALEQELEDLLGCAVQVVSRRGLSPYLRSRIMAEATVL